MKNFFKNKGWPLLTVGLLLLLILYMVIVVPRPSFIDEYMTERAIMRLDPPQEFIEGRVLKIVVTITDHPWPYEEGSKSMTVYLCSGDTWLLEMSERELHSTEHWAFVYTPKGCD